MPYSPPGIDVIQELDSSAVATSSPAQPVVIIGPAFQIVDDELAGNYVGSSLTVGYDAAGVVDTRAADPDAIASAEKEITLELREVAVEFLSEADAGGDHVTSVTIGASNGWSVNDTDAVFSYDAGEDAIAASLRVGDFVGFSGLPNVWFKVTAIDLVAREVSWLGGVWEFGNLAAQAISARRPAIADSTEPGDTTWTDATQDFGTLAVAVGDELRVTKPSRFAQNRSVLSVDDDYDSILNLDGGSLLSTREALGTALLTNGSAAVDSSAGTADFAAAKVILEAGSALALYDSESGAFIPVSSIASATAATLAVNWPGAGATTRDLNLSYMGPTALVAYSVRRARPDLALARDNWPYLQIDVTADDITIPAGLLSGGKPIVEAELRVSYRALDESRAALTSVADLAELQALFTAGDAALVPANPVGFAAKMALANTSNPVWLIGYDETYFTSEASAFAEALSLLEEKGVYTLVTCSMRGDLLAPLLKVHVEDQSDEDKTYFRIGTFTRTLVTQEDVVADTTTGASAPDGVAASGLSLTHVGHATTFPLAGVLVGQKVQITEAVGPTKTNAGHVTPATRLFTDENNLFPGVDIGDELVIEGGTDAGTYAITYNEDGVITTDATLTGDDVSGEETEAAAEPILAGGALSPAALTGAPLVAETVVLTGDVAGVGIETGVTGVATATPVNINLGVPIKTGTVVTLDINGAAGAQQITIDAADAFTKTAGTMTINAGSCTIDRATGEITIDRANTDDNSGDDWTADFTGYISAVVDEDGVVTGAGLAGPGALDEDTGAFTGLVSVYDSTGGGAYSHGTALVAAYRPRVSYHLVPKAAANPLVSTEHSVSGVASDVLSFSSSILGSFVGPLRSVAYRVVKDLTLDEQATAMAGIASSPSISSRRMVMVGPDIAVAPINNVEVEVPGYHFGAALGALVDELPSQQGLTRRGIAGLTGRVGGKDYFRTKARLNTMAGGGIMLFESDGEGQGVYIRHQLTTDVSAILFQELSMTKNIDSVSAEAQTALDSLIGGWNVQDGLFVVIKTRIGSLINKWVNTRLPRIGGKMKPGSKLTSAAEVENAPDQVEVIVDGRFPVPLNKITLRIRASS